MMPTVMDSMARFARPAFAGARPQPPKVAGLGQTWDGMMGLPGWVGDVVRFLVHGSTGMIGMYLGLTASGFWSTAGWTVGVMSAFAALLDVCSIIGRIMGKE
jgi:hypothetical protein